MKRFIVNKKIVVLLQSVLWGGLCPEEKQKSVKINNIK